MKCYCCNVILSTAESCARFKSSGTFTEMCNVCIRESDLQGNVIKQGRKESEEENYDKDVVELDEDDEDEYVFDSDNQ